MQQSTPPCCQPSFTDIKGVCDYSLDELRHATHNYLVVQMMYEKAATIVGQPAEEAMLIEYTQLLDRDTFAAEFQHDLSYEDWKSLLRPLDFVKVKRDGRVKGRSCLGGRQQREWISKEKSTSPTMTNEGLQVILIRAAKEKRHVVTADTAGAYLNTEMDDVVFVKIQGRMIDIFLN